MNPPIPHTHSHNPTIAPKSPATPTTPTTPIVETPVAPAAFDELVAATLGPLALPVAVGVPVAVAIPPALALVVVQSAANPPPTPNVVSAPKSLENLLYQLTSSSPYFEISHLTSAGSEEYQPGSVVAQSSAASSVAVRREEGIAVSITESTEEARVGRSESMERRRDADVAASRGAAAWNTWRGEAWKTCRALGLAMVSDAKLRMRVFWTSMMMGLSRLWWVDERDERR